MRYFKAELDTRKLTFEQEENLVNELEEIRFKLDSDTWSEFYEGDFQVTPVQLPEFVNSRDDNWIYGKLMVEGEVTTDVLAKIYYVFDEVVPFTDNDPFDLIREKIITDLIVKGVPPEKLSAKEQAWLSLC